MAQPLGCVSSRKEFCILPLQIGPIVSLCTKRINAAPSKDQQEELGQLKELPRRWLAALRAVVETEAIERGRMSWEVCAPMITVIVQPFGCEVSTAKR
jgi:hypothetical protein